MSKMPVLIILIALTILLARAADWLSYGGDAQRTGWQKREKGLNAGNVHELKLLWKRKLDIGSTAVNALTSPVLLGPIITHRGIKELVFVASSSDNVYAVDADLGRLFWERHIDTAAESVRKSKSPCGGSGLTATPVIGPPQTPTVNDDDGEGSTPLRPLYVLSSDGRLHSIRPSDGKDIADSVKFVIPNARAANLNLAAESIYTTTSNACGGTPNGMWTMPVNRPNAKATFTALRTPGDPRGGVSVASDGTVYSAVAGSILTPIPFTSKGRKLIATARTQGRLALLDAADSRVLSQTAPLANDDARGLATWEDAGGARWIYVALRNSIEAFQVTGNEPTLMRVWTANGLLAPEPPIVANGIMFALAAGGSSHATLYALNAATGAKLFSSGDAIESAPHASGLAEANGHVCFTTADSTLYCFGIPIEI